MVTFKTYGVINWETNNFTATQILPNTSRSKSSQTMKFGLLIEYSVRNILVQKSYRKKAARLLPDLTLFFSKKVLSKVKASSQHLSFNIFW